MSNTRIPKANGTTLVDIEEAARRLYVSPMTVRRWINQGKLPSVRIGEKLIRIKTNVLEDFIDGKDLGEAAQAPQKTAPDSTSETDPPEDGLPAIKTDDWLTAGEVAKLAGLKTGSINKLAQRGRLKGEKKGKLWIFDRKEIDSWLKERQSSQRAS